jgi:hypothetical protein
MKDLEYQLTDIVLGPHRGPSSRAWAWVPNSLPPAPQQGLSRGSEGLLGLGPGSDSSPPPRDAPPGHN